MFVSSHHQHHVDPRWWQCIFKIFCAVKLDNIYNKSLVVILTCHYIINFNPKNYSTRKPLSVITNVLYLILAVLRVHHRDQMESLKP